jgi:uncharacterized MAPEG superfamily protein
MTDAALLILGLTMVGAVCAQGLQTDIAFGLRYGASPRDEERGDVLSRRLARVVRNQVEGVAMALPAILLLDGGGGLAATAILAHAATRPVHAVLYAFGAGAPRSAVWLVGLACLLVAYGAAAVNLFSAVP